MEIDGNYGRRSFQKDVFVFGETIKIASKLVNSNLAWQESVRIDIVWEMSASPLKKRFLNSAMIGLLVVLAFAGAVSSIDALALSLFCSEGQPGDVKKLIAMFEIFGHGTGVLVVALLVYVLDPDGVRRSLKVLACGFLAGLAVVCVKPFLIRVRPSKLDMLFEDAVAIESKIGFQWSADFSAKSTDAASGFFHDALHSFPSGHTATACALAWCLSRMYPNGRFVFWGFAAMVAAQRLFAQAHYLSDTIAGAIIGVLVATMVNRFWVEAIPSPVE